MSVTVETKGAAFVTHAPELLFSLIGIRAPGGGGLPTYHVAPDGERFLFVKMAAGRTDVQGGSTLSRIIVVQNWLEELKQRVPVK